MRKIVTTLIIAGLLSATSVAPAFADGYYNGRVDVFNPLWPVAAALSIPAAIVGAVANLPVPVVYGYPAPVVYSNPYYQPGPYYAPYGPRGYYAPRGYYPYRGYRGYRRGW
jgi:hypothetical protein